MKKITALILITSLCCFLFDCKKYAEDDRRYYKTACGRIAKKWVLYKIIDVDGRDYSNDTILYYVYVPNKLTLASIEKITYNGMILEFDKINKWLCAEIGLVGNITCNNRMFTDGRYELKYHRTTLKLGARPAAGCTRPYFDDEYEIVRLSSNDLILKNYNSEIFFHAL